MPCSESVALLPQPIAFRRRAVTSIASGSLQTKRQSRSYYCVRKFVDVEGGTGAQSAHDAIHSRCHNQLHEDTPSLRFPSPASTGKASMVRLSCVESARWTARRNSPTPSCREASQSFRFHKPRSIRKQNWRRCSHCSHPMPPLPTLLCLLSSGRIPTAKAVLSQGRNELLTGLESPSGPSETLFSAWNERGSLRGEFRISQPVQHDARRATRCRRDRDRVLSVRPMSSLGSNHCPPRSFRSSGNQGPHR